MLVNGRTLLLRDSFLNQGPVLRTDPPTEDFAKCVGTSGNMELRPYRPSLADGMSDVGFKERRIPTHQSFLHSTHTKESAGKSRPVWADLGESGCQHSGPALPLGLQQPGIGQHSHCEKKWLAWGWEVSVLLLG